MLNFHHLMLNNFVDHTIAPVTSCHAIALVPKHAVIQIIMTRGLLDRHLSFLPESLAELFHE